MNTFVSNGCVETHTGGGYRSYRLDLVGNLYLQIADDNGMTPQTETEPLSVCLFDDSADGDLYADSAFGCANAAELFAWITETRAAVAAGTTTWPDAVRARAA